jgi:hypothetical protein
MVRLGLCREPAFIDKSCRTPPGPSTCRYAEINATETQFLGTQLRLTYELVLPRSP